MDVIDIVLGFVLNGVLILIFRSILEASHTRDITRIESENQKTLAHLNAQLDRSIKMQLTLFTSLHESRAHAIVELYKRLAQAESKLKYAHLPQPRLRDDKDTPWWQRAANIMRPTTEAVNALAKFYNENKILFTRSVVMKMDRIVSMAEELQSSALMRELHRDSPPDEQKLKEFADIHIKKSLSQAFTTYEEVYPQLKEDLEAEFRTMLGFDIEVSPLPPSNKQ